MPHPNPGLEGSRGLAKPVECEGARTGGGSLLDDDLQSASCADVIKPAPKADAQDLPHRRRINTCTGIQGHRQPLAPARATSEQRQRRCCHLDRPRVVGGRVMLQQLVTCEAQSDLFKAGPIQRSERLRDRVRSKPKRGSSLKLDPDAQVRDGRGATRLLVHRCVNRRQGTGDIVRREAVSDGGVAARAKSSGHRPQWCGLPSRRGLMRERILDTPRQVISANVARTVCGVPGFIERIGEVRMTQPDA